MAKLTKNHKPPTTCTKGTNFWQCFVVRADAYLTYNLNSSLGFANGTPVKLHSLSFQSQQDMMKKRSN